MEGQYCNGSGLKNMWVRFHTRRSDGTSAAVYQKEGTYCYGKWNTGCPTRYRTRHFFTNSNTNEDIATNFEQEYVRCVRNEEECVCSAPKFCDAEQRFASQPAWIDKVISTAMPGEVWMQMVATSSTCYDVTFLTQRTYSCSNFIAISSLLLELLKKCRVR
jgi:hypothetical protein